MSNVLADIVAHRDNTVQRVDARAKLAVALAAIVAVVSSSHPGMPTLVLACCLAGLLGLRVPLRLVLLRLSLPLAIVLVLIFLKTFMTGTEALFSFELFGWTLSATREGLTEGLLLGSRVLGAVSAVVLLSFTTPPHHLFGVLRWLKVSRDWVEVALLMYRYTFLLMNHADDIGAAQRMRLGYRGFRRSLESMGTLVGAVFIRSVDQGARTHEAMHVRGYTGYMPFAPMPAMRGLDKCLALAGVVAVVGGYTALEWIAR